MAQEAITTDSGGPEDLTARWERLLRTKRNVERSARYVLSLKLNGIPRRERPGHVLDRLEANSDRLRNRDGTPFEIDDAFIDAVFGEDGSCRWWDDVCVFAYREPRQLGQRRVVQRLIAIDFAIRLNGWDEKAFAQRLALVSPAAGPTGS